MKKKKGFTLIELLSVIVILSMIALIAVPVVYKSIQSSREKAYALQVENIEAQAKKWAEMNTSELPNEDNDLVFVKVLDLKQEGYIKEDDIVDPRNNKAMNGCVVIQYDASYNQYEYTYKEEECDTLKTDEYQPIIVVEGIKNVERLADTVEVNTKYNYPNVKATDYNGTPIEVMGPVIMEKGKNTVISNVDTSVIDKEFELIYTAYDAKKDTEKKVIVTVTVIDTTPPVLTVNGHTTDFSITIEAGESFTIPTATATDNSKLTPTIDTSGSVNIKVPGNYKITYTATDSKGNIKTLILTVKVVDTILPTVTISGNPTTWTNQNVTIVVNASDSGSGLASSAYSYDGGSTWTTGNSKIISSNTTLNIWVKDNAGNTTKNTVVIDKIDKIAPILTVGGHISDYTISIAPTSSYTLPSGSATDNVTANPTISTSGTFNSNVEGTYPITYTATDEAGNSKSLVLTVNVVITTYTFDYTGDVQTFTVPVSGIYKLEVWGAQGGSGGNGGYSVGYKELDKGTIIYIGVGGIGAAKGYQTNGGSVIPYGGYNGGGNGGRSTGVAEWGGPVGGGGGGGATHMAFVSGTLASIGKTTFDSQGLIVAGGGGGGANGTAGTGGGTSGGDATGCTGGSQTAGGTGSTSTTAGSFGTGAAGRNWNWVGAGGGGGGYYGGGSSNSATGSNSDCGYSGAGGSGWIGGVTSYAGNSAFMENGTNSGNGHATITFMASE